MATELTRENFLFLQRELVRWQEDELLSGGQGAAILSQYCAPEKGGKIVSILSTIGAILVGLGVILFIGSNWQKLAAAAKITLIGCSIVTCYSTAWYLKFADGGKPKVGDALFLLGSLLYGAGIWLIAQIFHIPEGFSEGMLLWFAGVVPIAFASKSRLVAILTSVLGGVWMLSETRPVWEVAGPLIAMFGGAYFTRCRWALSLALLSVGAWVSVVTGPVGLILAGCAAFVWYLWHRSSLSWGSMSGPYLYAAMLSTFIGWTYLTPSTMLFSIYGFISGQHAVVNLLSIGALLITGIGFVYPMKDELGKESALLLLAASTLLVAIILPPLSVSVVVVDLMVTALLFAWLYYSINVIESPGITALTAIFFVLQIGVFYFEECFKMLDRSLFFAFGGAVLLIAGALLERKRKRGTTRLAAAAA